MTKRLVVLVPALTGSPKRWGHLRERLEREPGLAGAHWLSWDHKAWRHVFTRPETFARKLRAIINAEYQKVGGYDEIVLVGHSFGGLLVRYAYLLGFGAIETSEVDEWCGRVRRIILFAAVNRGFNPQNLHALRFAHLIWRWLPGNLATRLEAGSDFITNLRIQWIRHFLKLGDAAPVVVQLLGTEDGIVTREDSHDVMQFPNAWEIEVPDANHANLYRLESAPDPEARYQLIRGAFLKPVENRSFYRQREKRDPVVFILHGIRASNSEWVEQARRHVVESFPQAEVVVSSYGYFPAPDFAIPALRRRGIEWFKDRYSYYYAQYPDADFYFLGHSNGTYLLGRALERVPAMRFVRVVLAGSVLPRGYPWETVFDREQLQWLRNDRSNKDVPVGILCSALRGLGMRDVGTAGVDGFDFNDERTTEVFYYDGGHSEALQEVNIPKLVEHLLYGSGADAELKELRVNKPHPWFEFLSRSAPYLAVTLLACATWWIASSWRTICTMEWWSETGWVIAATAVLGIMLLRAI